MKSYSCMDELVSSRDAEEVALVVQMNFPDVPPNPFPDGSELSQAYERACSREVDGAFWAEKYAAREESRGPQRY